jgi:hypothetical protein
MTITGIADRRRYIAIYRKWFNERLGAWELEMVAGTLRWLDRVVERNYKTAESLDSEPMLSPSEPKSATF